MKKIGDWIGLLKYRLSLAVTFSSVTGYLICENRPGKEIFLLTAGVFLMSGGAAALNQYTERDLDAKMNRTMFRPIPGEMIEPSTALFISVILLISGIIILLLAGIVPALLGITAVILYNLVYTGLKRISWFAVFPGALVGAIPPLIGFTVAGGKDPSSGIILFSSFMFLWQLPHFWLIIMRYRNDYQKAGFKTFPEFINESHARILVFIWASVTSVLLALVSIKELVFSSVLTIILIPLNVLFILFFYTALFSSGSDSSAKRAFILINSFSLAIMILFIVNSCLG